MNHINVGIATVDIRNMVHSIRWQRPNDAIAIQPIFAVRKAIVTGLFRIESTGVVHAASNTNIFLWGNLLGFYYLLTLRSRLCPILTTRLQKKN